MGLRKLLAILLLMSMLVSFIPASVLATEAEEGTGNTGAETGTAKLDNLFLDKKAVLKDDGTYTIDLEAYATGTTINKTITEGVPLDVVMVIDQSGSLYKTKSLDTLKSSVRSFLEDLNANGEQFGVNHRVAICGFASYGKQGTAGLAKDGYTYANDNWDNVWTNTGIFVDGEFRDYGAVGYTKVQSYSEISTSGVYAVAVKFAGQEKAETINVVYREYYWRTASSGKPVNLFEPVLQENAAKYLFDKFNGYVYKIGDSVNRLTDEDYAASWENIASGSNGQGGMNPNITEAVNHLASNGATATFMGMKMARKMLENAPDDGISRKKVVIVFTDGEPGASGYAQGDADAALAEAMRIKKTGTEIYTIGIYDKESAETAELFMNQLSSNYVSHSFTARPITLTKSMIERTTDDDFGYSDVGNMYYTRNIDYTITGISPYFNMDDNDNYWPINIQKVQDTYYISCLTDEGESNTASDRVYQLTEHIANSDPNADYYKYAFSIDELSGIFETISSEVTSYTSQLSLGANAILKDVLADGFTLTDNTTITVSVVPGSVSEENKNLLADQLTDDKITWGNPQQVLSFAYPAKTSADGKVTVTGAADQTQMTLTATANADGEITVTGFNYAKPEDAGNINAQYISYGHPGSKLVVTITGVEAEADITTDSVIATNQTTSGIYEGSESDADGDEEKGEIQASFPVPTTYLSSKTYYVDYSGELVIDPADFLMTIKGVSADIDGYNYFNTNTPGTTLELEHGTVTVREDGKWIFTMDPGDWSITDSFFLFGTTDDTTVTGATANKDGNMWSKITLITPKDAGGKLFLDKEATLTGDGTYTIDLEAFATGTPATTVLQEGVPLDADAMLKDVMADGFTLTDNTTITVSVVPGSVGEAYQDVAASDLTADMIVWGEAQQVLSFSYPAETQGTGTVTVIGAADQTQMTLTATATADGVITVTGFNYGSPADNWKNDAQYINADHPGSKLVVTVTGVEAKADVATDSITVTNKGTSGIYESEDSDLDGDGVKGELQASFPVPTTYLTSKVYVSDYAKPMTVDPADWKMNDGVISVDADGYNYFDPAVTAVTQTYGKVAVNDGKIIYTPTKTSWDNFDTFYIFGTTNDETVKAATANAGGNMWAKVSVIPANNVYYEDTFVTSEDTGIAGIVYGGVWDNIREDNGQTENAESGESTDGDNQGGVHGWENTLADDTGFSDGSAHISTTVGATATFTFTGTGVDIYSRTNMQTGIVMAMLYEGSSITDEDGKNKIAEYGLMVDNLAASGDYYQIPTLSLCQIPVREDDGKIVLDENGNMVMEDMPYGTYTVKIVVSKATADQIDAERLTYYLDGIRVYNPIQELEGNSTVSGAYGDKELNAKFVEIRDKLLDASAFTVENEEAAGPVFIDRITSEDGEHTDNTVTLEVGEYKVFGPKNEVYLSAGQTVAFAVEYAEDAHYYIGMKSLTGKTAGVVVSDADSETSSLSIGHTTDLYYEVNPVWTDEEGNPYTDAQGNPIGIISIMADAQNGQSVKDANGNDIYDGTILALTKLKVTGPKAKNFRFAKISKSKLVESAQKAANNLPDVDAGDSDTQKPQLGKVAKWNIALQEDFEVKFYLQISEGMEDTAKVSLSMGSGNIIYDVSALEKTEEGYYLLKARLAATQMSETMSLQLIHGDDACEIGTYSVRGYCDTILSSDEYRAYHTLVKEMLNYGGMAQLYFNYETLNLANAGITGTAAAAVPESTAGMAVADKLSGVDFYGASLVYRDKIALRYYFTGDVTGLTFTANGKTYTPVAKGDMYYVEIADILPQELDQQITLTAMDVDGNAISVTYGPMNYIVRMHAKGSDALKNLMKALYNYHLAAKAWSEQ